MKGKDRSQGQETDEIEDKEVVEGRGVKAGKELPRIIPIGKVNYEL